MRVSSSPGIRLSALALATQLLIAGCIPAAFAQESNDGAPRRREPISLNFNNADIESIARTMAVVTGQDFVVDPRVKGTMTLVTDRPVPPTAALNQFATALRLQGFSIVQADGLYKIVPEADAKLQSSTVSTSVGAAEKMSGNQIVTQVFKLNYESANNILPVLRPLIAPNNTINVNPGNNSLIITDYAENLRRLARIVASLDVPNASDVEVIPLKHSVATDLAPLVVKLMEGTGGGTGGAPGAPGGGDASFKTTLLPEPRSNSLILRAANPARAQLVRSLIEKLDRPAATADNGEAGNIYVVYLKNADAVRLATTLRAAMAAISTGAGGAAASAVSSTPASNTAQMASNTSSSSSSLSSGPSANFGNAAQPSTGGQIQADPSTNSLIITAPEPMYRQLRAIIDKLDARRAQVLVECLVVEVNTKKMAEFGFQWQGVLGSGTNAAVVGTNSSVLGAGGNILNVAAAIANKNPAALAALPAGINIGLGHKMNGQYVLSGLANFLESNGDGNVLATPNILTLDNEEAKIIVGQNVPMPTGQYTNTTGGTGVVNPFQTIDRKDVGLTLRVKPQINENGTVKMTVYQEVSNIDQSTIKDASGPTTNKRSIESNVLVNDGSIVVLGGLLQDDYSNSQDKVPGLGDIPILGGLFRNETRTRNKTNLMVFLRPTVIRDAPTSDSVSIDRYDAIRTIQQGVQPTYSLPLSAVSESAVLPFFEPKPPSQATPSNEPKTRIEGTHLIPPPRPAPPPPAPAPLRGALPPTSDPASSRESP